ncbi:helix-turn-helix transcriptional regulator [Cedecea davisae]|uniref:Helix-turn-helix transcriptional regulator n=1 Tax=Cedecea davisae TaxID=158484 RepID=A0ABS6DC75_9ENTR|nr:helix-turn-helix transcriptional regulator [Cedecea davisae]MBU4680682.1 helix-turn-helix transcriptional regulator [Cedecea davisae]MBU4685654.1 helix-turn-helix transcriptional regulator [Cedecea davisae]
MSWLNADAEFNPDELNQSVIGVQAELGNHDSGLHRHRMGQLLFTREGCVKLAIHEGQMLSLLPPGKVAWLPGGVSHRAEMKNSVAYRSIWFDPERYPTLPAAAIVLNVTPLLHELLERMSASPWETNWQLGAAQHMAALCVAELEAAREEPMTLRFVQDKRLRHLSGDELPPQLHELAAVTGASERTIGRIFRRETGLSYQQWRQQWRLMKAVEMLASGERISTVAGALGFSSDSAFIFFYRSMTGQTPGML